MGTKEELLIDRLHQLRDTDYEDEEAMKLAEVGLEEAFEAVGANPSLTQDQAVDFLNSTRESSWDIPSALGSLCSHPYPDIDDFPMHRDTQAYWPNTFQPWPNIDLHFKEVHHIDLSDFRINWSFDT